MRLFVSIAAIAAVLSFNPAFAEDVTNQEPVRIEINQKAKAFVFIIDNEPVGFLDKSGLTILGDMRFGGITEDLGVEGVKARLTNDTADGGRDD